MFACRHGTCCSCIRVRRRAPGPDAAVLRTQHRYVCRAHARVCLVYVMYVTPVVDPPRQLSPRVPPTSIRPLTFTHPSIVQPPPPNNRVLSLPRGLPGAGGQRWLLPWWRGGGGRRAAHGLTDGFGRGRPAGGGAPVRCVCVTSVMMMMMGMGRHTRPRLMLHLLWDRAGAVAGTAGSGSGARWRGKQGSRA